uniref:NADH-ubiquinone oxidoreductase chain 6 n=1 Tax=Serrognathus castanicolor TaxID=3074308 RepID=A0AA51YNA9_9SCAR|nr:NADH dehydrogenase subunit 6 [Serrognathus castanicolor]WMW30257.1 NADH dehydrogenase subunit 6 [Serrognathus castanicolor]
MFFFLSVTPALIIPFINHPLSMGLALLMQTIMIAIITGWMNLTFWYSYIFLLIMIGGMLVLFMYMTSVASNEKFKFSLPLSMMLSWLVILGGLYSLMTDYWLMTFKITIVENLKTSAPFISLNKFLNFPSIMISILLIIYLLITLIVVIKISKFKQGPLRNFN